jgi:8-oxo-dGTP pyrophosphatase MutT (NUDIX family)
MPKSINDEAVGKCAQVAALPWRIDDDGTIRVLLVTSRTNGKWMLPKGWPMPGITDADAALIEAQEEAGIEGIVSPLPVGSYHYIKLFDDGSTIPAQAVIYPVRVTSEHPHWPEKGQRARKWFRPRKAAKLAFEPDLSRFLSDLVQERVVLF